MPPTKACPLVGTTRVVSMPAVVVLPAPFGPSRPKISPRSHRQVEVVDGDDVGRVELGQALGADHLLDRRGRAGRGGLGGSRTRRSAPRWASRRWGHPCPPVHRRCGRGRSGAACCSSGVKAARRRRSKRSTTSTSASWWARPASVRWMRVTRRSSPSRRRSTSPVGRQAVEVPGDRRPSTSISSASWVWLQPGVAQGVGQHDPGGRAGRRSGRGAARSGAGHAWP